MENTQMSKEKFKLKNVPQKVKDVAAFLSAVLVIFTALVGAGHWIVKEVTASTNDRIDTLEEKIEGNQKENKLAILRLELLTLIESDPENIVEVEKVAKAYFSAGGDWYLTGLYSRYAKQYGADTSFVVYH